MPSFSLFPKRSSYINDARSYSIPSSSRQHSPSTSFSADSFYSMPYSDCTSLGSPTPVPTANPLRIYQELEAIDLASRSQFSEKEASQSRSSGTEMQYGLTTKALSPNPRRISVCSSFYSTDDIPP